MRKFIIIPNCSDINRGDQALAWETKRIALDAGYVGEYYLLSESYEPTNQSIEEGFRIINPILGHPSKGKNNNENIRYTIKLKIKWGFTGIIDTLATAVLLNKVTRLMFRKIVSKSRQESLKVFEESDAIFLKGGGLFQSHGGLTSTYATYNRAYHIFLASSLKKKVFIMPNSFGPNDGFLVKTILKKCFSKCEFIAAREKTSKEVFKNDLNMDIPQFPDLAFYLENANEDKNEYITKYRLDVNKPLVAITMRPYRFPNSLTPDQDYEKFKNEIAKFIDNIYSKGYMPVLIEHTFSITSHENDGACISDVVCKIDSNKYVLISDRSLNCRQLKLLYSCCDYIVGTRFHSMIFSLENLVPGIAISYDGFKSIGIMNDMDLGKYVIDIGEVTEEKLTEMFFDMIDNKEQIITKIKNYREYANLERSKLINAIKCNDDPHIND